MNPMASQHSKPQALGFIGVSRQMRSRPFLDQVQWMGKAILRMSAPELLPTSIPPPGRPLPGLTHKAAYGGLPTSHQRFIHIDRGRELPVRIRACHLRLLIPSLGHEWIHLEGFHLSVRMHTARRVQGWEDPQLWRASG